MIDTMQVIKQMFKDYCFKSALAKSFNAILFPLHFNTKRSGSIAGNGRVLAKWLIPKAKLKNET